MTAQRAADLERQAIRAYVRRRFLKIYGSSELAAVELSDVLAWLDKRTARCNQRRGGLGRK